MDEENLGAWIGLLISIWLYFYNYELFQLLGWVSLIWFVVWFVKLWIREYRDRR